MQASEPTTAELENEKGRFSPKRFSPRTWTLIVFLIGLALGTIFSLLIQRTATTPLRALRVEIDYIDIVVASVEMSFLVSLLYLYNRTYLETRARFAFGVIVVLVALLFQAVLSYSVFYVVMVALVGGHTYLASALTLAADFAEAVAFGVFLYIGLQ